MCSFRVSIKPISTPTISQLLNPVKLHVKAANATSKQTNPNLEYPVYPTSNTSDPSILEYLEQPCIFIPRCYRCALCRHYITDLRWRHGLPRLLLFAHAKIISCLRRQPRQPRQPRT